ncbi:hypothetical protein ABTP16_15990, partial [Acinetobacter baumannii]
LDPIRLDQNSLFQIKHSYSLSFYFYFFSKFKDQKHGVETLTTGPSFIHLVASSFAVLNYPNRTIGLARVRGIAFTPSGLFELIVHVPAAMLQTGNSWGQQL